MSEDVSSWARGRFGGAAEEIRWRVAKAVASAHSSAARAQAVSDTDRRDPYGHTIKNTQHERLVDELRDLPGVKIHQPPGAPYELVTLLDQRVTFYPLRYANDGHTSREKAKIRMSTIRMDLLGPADPADLAQLTIDHAALTPEEIDEQFEAEAEIERQLGSLSSVVIIGYASSPEGIHDLGWGEGSLGIDGHLSWGPWERLPLPGSSTGGAGFGDLGGPAPVSPVPVTPRPGSGTGAEQEPGRFDDDVDDDHLEISARRGEPGVPQQEKADELEQTGPDEDQP